MAGVPADTGVVSIEASLTLDALVQAKDGVTTRAIAGRVGLDLDVTDDTLTALAMVGLAESVSPGRWRPHPALRDGESGELLGHLLALLAGHVPRPSREARVDEPSHPEPLPLGAAARRLGVRPETLKIWAREGRVPYTLTAGGRRRFDVDEVQAHLAGTDPGAVRSGRAAPLRSEAA